MADTRTSTMVQVKLSELKESDLNPRKEFGLDELKGLAETMKAQGVLEPLIVREISNGKGAAYEIIAGARRFRAAKIAGLAEVPCLVRDVDDRQAMELMLVENLQRKDLSALEEADGYAELVKKAAYDVKAIAAKIGRGIGYVYARLKLVDLAPGPRQLVESEKLSPAHAVRIARLDPAVQKDIATNVVRSSWSVRTLEDVIQRDIHRSLIGVAWKLDDEKLLPAAGSCMKCPFRSAKETHPDLKPNTCLKPSCYQEKAILSAKRQVAAATKTGETPKKVVKLSFTSSYTGMKREKDVLYVREWLLSGKDACAHAATGVTIDSGWNGQKKVERGVVLPICMKPLDCEMHKHKPERIQKPASQVTRERKIREAAELDKAVRTRALGEILKRVKTGLLRCDLEIAAYSFFNEIWHEVRKFVVERHGWTVKVHEDSADVVAVKIQKMSDAELRAFIIELALARSMEKPMNRRDLDLLSVIAKKRSVNLKAIERSIIADRKTAEKLKLKAEALKKDADKAVAKLDKERKARPVRKAKAKSAKHPMSAKKTKGSKKKK